MIVKGPKNLLIKKGAILVIQLGDIGDVVLTLPAIRSIRTSYPDNAITVCVRSKAKGIVDLCEDVDRVIVVDTGKRGIFRKIVQQIRFIRDVRRTRYDAAFDFRTGTRGAIVSWLSGARSRVGYFDRDQALWRNRVFTHLARIDYRIGTYVSEFYFDLLRHYQFVTPDFRPRIRVPRRLVDSALAVLNTSGGDHRRPYVVLQPFSLWPYKELPGAVYASLCKALSSQHGLQVVVCGGPDERLRADAVFGRPGVSMINLVGKTDLSQLAGLLREAVLFIGIDSAGIHIAAAVGTPTVGIFGPSSPASWAPRGRIHRVVTAPMPCVPCRRKGCNDSLRSLCLEAITVDDIMAQVTAALHAGRSLTKDN